MILEFDYIEEEPIIPAILENSEKRISLEFFVDSGADITMIPLSFARLLGFNKWAYEELETAKGVEGGSIPYFVREVNIILKEQKFKIKLACSVRDDVPFLLGRKGLFDKFIVCLDEKKKKVRFHPNKNCSDI